ncbi:hypothetical protein SESBI_12444 [Sesbania bispinosa]|nr:hypothetical protein SESBI_12444 [Sesbania bispinosa]
MGDNGHEWCGGRWEAQQNYLGATKRGGVRTGSTGLGGDFDNHSGCGRGALGRWVWGVAASLRGVRPHNSGVERRVVVAFHDSGDVWRLRVTESCEMATKETCATHGSGLHDKRFLGRLDTR